MGTPRVDLIAGRPVSHPGRVIRPDIQRASDTIFTADRTSTEEAVKEQKRSRRRRGPKGKQTFKC